jgi:hypothetical protein
MSKTYYKFNNYILIIILTIIYMLFILINNKYRLKTRYFKLNKSKTNIDNIRKHLNKKYNIDSKNYTTHIWNSSLNTGDVQDNIIKINEEILYNIGSQFDYVPSMTEIYYSANKYSNSDKNYIMEHMDGPFYNCSFYRALIVISGNKSTYTVINDDNININLKTYDVLMFDYNNTLHYIDVNEDTIKNDNQRILIKLHYIKNNNNKKKCTMLHNKYGTETRTSFEYNKNNDNFYNYITYSSLSYNSKRRYVIILLIILLLIYIKTKNNKLLIPMLAFTFIEFIGILYYLHFYL